MRNEEKVVAAFQSWCNGGTQTSNIVLASKDGQQAVNDFIEQHNNSGTFATLRTFTSEDEAWAVYDLLNYNEF